MKAAELLLLIVFAWEVSGAERFVPAPPSPYDPAKAASYLDSREAWWLTWKVSQRDHGTACVSCHTALPYALSRPRLHSALHEEALTDTEAGMLANIRKRVALWAEVDPFYTDANSGPGKSVGSRNSEAIINALILASYDSHSGKLSDSTVEAFHHIWSLQLNAGPEAGSWIWLNFHNAPWENDDSPYLGASLAAIAAGIAPGNYRSSPEIRKNIDLLAGYLRSHFDGQPLLNQAMAVWASAQLPDLLTRQQQTAFRTAVSGLQRDDGGWSLATLGDWKRHDGTAQETRSDGYATGIVTLALQSSGSSAGDRTVKAGLAWLSRNQDPDQGAWHAYSLNKQRDLNSDVGKFMSDAATAYAVLSLTVSQ